MPLAEEVLAEVEDAIVEGHSGIIVEVETEDAVLVVTNKLLDAGIVTFFIARSVQPHSACHFIFFFFHSDLTMEEMYEAKEHFDAGRAQCLVTTPTWRRIIFTCMEADFFYLY
jgi:ABC-type sugar transport system substrate-binding protein